MSTLLRDVDMAPGVNDGADAVRHQILSDVKTGTFYNRLEPALANPQAYDKTARTKLRQASLKLTGLDASP